MGLHEGSLTDPRRSLCGSASMHAGNTSYLGCLGPGFRALLLFPWVM